MLLVTIFAVPILIVAIILAALKIKSKRLKIIGIAVPSVIAAVLLVFAVSDIFLLIDVLLLGDTDPNSQFVAPVEGMTDNEDGTFTYDDGEVSITFEQISSDAKDNAISEAPSVLNGESSGNEWTVVSDDEGVPKTVYVTSGDTTVSAKVNKTPKNSGKEYAASIAAALVTDKKPYSENKTENKYRTDSSSFYIEEANCLLYYPAQLGSFSKKGDSYIFKDKKSSAALKVTLSPNNYTSMAEVEGFIKNTENNLVLAYGPNWFTSESIKKGKVTFGYSGFGSKYIVEADLTYPEKNSEIYGELRQLVKCCFVGDGIWKSKASSEGYSKDRSTAYSDKFSREMAAYYSKEYGVILLYPEIFSEVEKQDGGVFFTDPVTEATISFWADSEYLSLADWPERYGLNDSYIDGERRVKASHTDGGTYAVMYLTNNKNVCAFLEYPMEYAWVYEEFEDEFTIVASGSEIRNIEMQTVFIEAYGALITMPLQFSETSFYDGVIRYEDAFNGMELTVSFDYLTSEKERKNLFACFDVVADDDNVFVGDSYVRWLSNQGFFYGARGKDMKVLMQIDSPNVRRAYESTLPMFSVEFVTEETKEVTKAQTIAQEVTGIAAMSDPPEETTESEENTPNSVDGKSDPPEKTTASKTENPVKDKSDPPEKTTASGAKTSNSVDGMSDPPEKPATSQESGSSGASGTSGAGTSKPNKVLYYANTDDFVYAMADFENWYNREIIGYYDNLLRGNSQSGNTNTSDSDDDWDYNFGSDDSWVDDFDCEQLHYDIVTTILKILAYNHYDLDYYGARYMDVDASEYEEYWMVYYLIRDVRTEMMMFEDDDYAYETDLGSGKPSVLEVICAILGIDKPEYVDYHEGTSSQILDIDEFEVGIPVYGPSNSGSSEPVLERYRINPKDTSKDAIYGYDQEMAETIERILATYSERDLVGYINMNYDDEELFGLADEMITYGALVDDYGYKTLMVYLLAKYPNDPVISALASGNTLPALYRYIYFDEYDDYGTNWGEPYFYDTKRSVWKITDSSEIENNLLLDDAEICKYIYQKYGDVCLAITASTYSDYKYPFWITNWEIDIPKAQYCRDWIVPSVMGVIDKYCREKHNFSLDFLNADAKPVTFSAGGSSHTGLLITVFDRNYIGSELVLNSKKIYLDLKTGALYDGNSVLGYIDLED